MARVGRKPFGLKQLQKLAASPLASLRLEWILRSLQGSCTIPEACEALGIHESRFHKLRGEWLQAAVECLEPRRPGPRSEAPSPEAAQIAALEQHVRDLQVELRTSAIRAELAETLPQAGARADRAPKKTAHRKLGGTREPRRRRKP